MNTSVVGSQPATPPATPAPPPAGVAALDSPGLSDSQAQSRLEDMFKRQRGDDRRGDDGKFQPKEAPQTAQEAPQGDEEAPEGDSPVPEATEALAAPDSDDPYAAPAGTEGGLPEEMEFDHGGKKYTVPKPLVEGALRQADYTKNMQEVAAEKRVVAAERVAMQARQAIVAELAPALAQVQNTEQHIASLRAQMPDPSVDPMGYIQFDKQVRDLEAGLGQLRDAVAQRGTELATQQQSATAELMREGFQRIAQKIPKWNDQSFRASVAEYAVAEGYTPDELAATTDPRMIKLMVDAMQYQKLRAGKPEARKKIMDAAPVVRPTGSVNQASAERAKAADAVARAKRSGTTQDAEAAVLALLRAGRKR